ncbi:hypothetical protein SVA_3510 [Sulfurifustis variabilis]|uniref:Transglycosylase SLT domain-containing protein n=1 Tax=Sulfurifustis variabilis TaxID=1675686 RepID=A0A1C7AFF7_9GAMM|nr:hypothetical protein SVA_3510 [Sulfurifustis variabilis]
MSAALALIGGVMCAFLLDVEEDVPAARQSVAAFPPAPTGGVPPPAGDGAQGAVARAATPTSHTRWPHGTGSFPVALSARGERYRALVEQAAREYTLDSALLHAVIATESAYDPRAVSPKGAVGLMQLMPETARRYGVSDAFDPGENVRAGARYLRDLLARFDNDVALSLAAYNAGERAVIDRGYRIPPYKETLRYVPAVLARYREIKGLPDS